MKVAHLRQLSAPAWKKIERVGRDGLVLTLV